MRLRLSFTRHRSRLMLKSLSPLQRLLLWETARKQGAGKKWKIGEARGIPRAPYLAFPQPPRAFFSPLPIPLPENESGLCGGESWNHIVLKTLHFWQRFQNDKTVIRFHYSCKRWKTAKNIDLKTVTCSGAKLVGLRGANKSKLGETRKQRSHNTWINNWITIKNGCVKTLRNPVVFDAVLRSSNRIDLKLRSCKRSLRN